MNRRRDISLPKSAERSTNPIKLRNLFLSLVYLAFAVVMRWPVHRLSFHAVGATHTKDGVYKKKKRKSYEGNLVSIIMWNDLKHVSNKTHGGGKKFDSAIIISKIKLRPQKKKNTIGGTFIFNARCTEFVFQIAIPSNFLKGL